MKTVDLDTITKLMNADPLMKVKWALEQGNTIYGIELLKETATYDNYAKNALATINSNQGATYFAEQILSQYEAETYNPINSGTSDPSSHWLIQKIQLCGANIFKHLPETAIVTAGAFAIAGVYGGSGVAIGTIAGYCVSSMGGERNDSKDVPFIGETKGGISQICDTKGNCWDFK